MPKPAVAVRDLLDRAVAAGILSPEQASAVVALDDTAGGDPARRRPRRGPRLRRGCAGRRRGAVPRRRAVGRARALAPGAAARRRRGGVPGRRRRARRARRGAGTARRVPLGGGVRRRGRHGRGGRRRPAARAPGHGDAGRGGRRAGRRRRVVVAAPRGAAARHRLRRGRRDAVRRAGPARRRHVPRGRPAAVGARVAVVGGVGAAGVRTPGRAPLPRAAPGADRTVRRRAGSGAPPSRAGCWGRRPSSPARCSPTAAGRVARRRAACPAALVVLGVRARRPWVAAVGTGGVFLSVPLAVGSCWTPASGPSSASSPSGSPWSRPRSS